MRTFEKVPHVLDLIGNLEKIEQWKAVAEDRKSRGTFASSDDGNIAGAGTTVKKNGLLYPGDDEVGALTHN